MPVANNRLGAAQECWSEAVTGEIEVSRCGQIYFCPACSLTEMLRCMGNRAAGYSTRHPCQETTYRQLPDDAVAAVSPVARARQHSMCEAVLCGKNGGCKAKNAARLKLGIFNAENSEKNCCDADCHQTTDTPKPFPTHGESDEKTRIAFIYCRLPTRCLRWWQKLAGKPRARPAEGRGRSGTASCRVSGKR